ncbi:prepilin-type N-terminal cleavage/methylation domain-containing protein [Candidatus Endomicrobiellum agilis]|uniref:prepilin-type N-terminal cleavage/methylation domain-containing protein n=1 Tax=Candidatus Endomicrobiellum agilis TaxID=3238957 RepID=UPI003589A20C|nr:prepilin-type N-terminal cleavage/methylation domain-containing protein [Endomicrobium sp.]
MISKKGFTLVEFIVVIVIVTILSIIAVPVYRSYIEKTKTAQNISAVEESASEKIPLGKQ